MSNFHSQNLVFILIYCKSSNENSVSLIENQILKDNYLNDSIINKYSKIIIENSSQDLEFTINSLYYKRNQNYQNFDEKSILKCLSFASQSKKCPIKQEILVYFYENLINLKNDLMTRSLSFRGLQTVIEIELGSKEFKQCQAKILEIDEKKKQILNQFLSYCKSFVKTIEEKLKINLELTFYQIEILIIIPQLDKDKIMKNLQNFTIELLQQNLFQKFQSKIEEEEIFKENCKQLDQNLQNQLTQILQLLLSDKFVKFESILDILKFMKVMEDKVIFNILYFSNDPYQKFKQKWIDKQLWVNTTKISKFFNFLLNSKQRLKKTFYTNEIYRLILIKRFFQELNQNYHLVTSGCNREIIKKRRSLQ